MSDTFRRRATAACLVLAPTGLLVAHLVQVSPRTHDTASELAAVAAHPERYQAAALIGFVSLLLFVPALLALAAPLWRPRPRTALIGSSMSFAGLLGLASLMGSGPVTLAMVQDGADRAVMAALTDRYESGLVTTVWALLMVVGWSLGPIVLAVGRWRSGGPAVVPALLVVGLGLQMSDAGRWFLAAGFACTALAFTVVASRPADGEQDVPTQQEPVPV